MAGSITSTAIKPTWASSRADYAALTNFNNTGSVMTVNAVAGSQSFSSDQLFGNN